MFRTIFFLIFVTNCFALYPKHGNVIELTPDNFDDLVINGKDIWIVEFFAPWCGHCKNLVPEYTKAATALKGVVKVGAVNADEHKELGARYDLRGYPTIKIFGENKYKPEDFKGGRTSKEIAEAGLQAVKQRVRSRLGLGEDSSKSSDSSDKNDVIELTDSNFDKLVLQSDDMWLVEFYAPWCGHCQNLAPHWAKAATELKGKVKLGALDATKYQSKASQYGIQGYPTIKFFPPGSKDSAVDYEGGRTADTIVAWAMDKLAENVPAPEVVEVTSEKVFKAACDGKPLCIISILPHILDCQSECRNNYIEMLHTLGEKFKKKMWGWVWCEAGSQPSIEEALDIGGFGYPAMAVVNSKKMIYSILRGSFSKDGIYEFLRDLSYGKGNTAPFRGQSLPKINDIEPWDGKDGELPQEEDIDLSDVDLDEKDEL